MPVPIRFAVSERQHRRVEGGPNDFEDTRAAGQRPPAADPGLLPSPVPRLPGERRLVGRGISESAQRRQGSAVVPRPRAAPTPGRAGTTASAFWNTASSRRRSPETTGSTGSATTTTGSTAAACGASSRRRPSHGHPRVPVLPAVGQRELDPDVGCRQREMLIPQTYSTADDEAHGRYLVEQFGDDRYIRVDGRPLLGVYRVQTLPDPARTFELWRRLATDAGVGEPYIVKFDSWADFSDPAGYGCDAAAEFPRTASSSISIHHPGGGRRGERDRRLSDRGGVLRRPSRSGVVRDPTVVPSWDNTPRRPNGPAKMLLGRDPLWFRDWLAAALERAGPPPPARLRQRLERMGGGGLPGARRGPRSSLPRRRARGPLGGPASRRARSSPPQVMSRGQRLASARSTPTSTPATSSSSTPMSSCRGWFSVGWRRQLPRTDSASPTSRPSCSGTGTAETTGPGSAGDEVLGPGVVADERRGGLFRLVLEAGLLAHLHAESPHIEQLAHREVVLEVGARRVAPRVAPAAVLLAEETGDRGPSSSANPHSSRIRRCQSSARASAISTPRPWTSR